MKKNNKGFTLAELLIVVAIIAVLVAIAIPIFNNSLEKSREGVDVANIRDYYAEIASGIVTGELAKTDDTVKVGGTLTATYSATDPTAPTVTVTGVKVNQTQKDWQSGDPTIAGVTVSTDMTNGGSAESCSVVFTYATDSDGDLYLNTITFSFN